MRDLEDLLRLGQLLPLYSVPFTVWSDLQIKQAKAVEPKSIIPTTRPDTNEDFWGMDGIVNTVKDNIQQSFYLDPDTTVVLLQQNEQGTLVEPIDVFIGSLLHAFRETFVDRKTPTVFFEGHGREPWDKAIDVTNTVGWFTSMCPISIENEKAAYLLKAIQGTRDLRRLIKDNGRAFWASRFHHPMGQELFGRFNDAMFEVVAEGEYETDDPSIVRFALFDGCPYQQWSDESSIHMEQKDAASKALEHIALCAAIQQHMLNTELTRPGFINSEFLFQISLPEHEKKIDLTSQDSTSFAYFSSGRETLIEDIESVMGPMFVQLISAAVLDPYSKIIELIELQEQDNIRALPYRNVTLSELKGDCGESPADLSNSYFNYTKRQEMMQPSTHRLIFETISARGSIHHALGFEINEVSRDTLKATISYRPSKLSEEQMKDVARVTSQVLSVMVASTEETLGLLRRRFEAHI
ncbi:nonribosomal peptide synthase Pes1 [Sclerotinia borealis F-4128]|uniref:Nonribosomal peptide synthase Pes1 n=1 Tax=Sclerotinia borealis (strain F-4128) TaxID=1432307 RepID=W9C3Q8_SCLBF|nr:nonribosomal peptide synthase Pes1 [Sclerotinia borealis F-4128]